MMMPQGIGDDDVAIHLHLGEASGESCLVLVPSNGAEAGAHVLGHPGSRVEPESHNGHIVVEANDGVYAKLQGLTKEHGTGVVPEEELDKKGDIAENFNVGRAEKPEPPPPGDPYGPDKNTQGQGDEPAEQTYLNSEPDALEQPDTVRLAPEDSPIKVIGQFPSNLSQRVPVGEGEPPPLPPAYFFFHQFSCIG